jgi:ferredoxin hydrogenase large subunit/hydrogenase large subunit
VATTWTLSPFTRIEGHLGIHTETEAIVDAQGKMVHRIASARCQGEMFRGFEAILAGRDPLDAQQVVQRICGACSISHALASIRAQEMAYGIRPSLNGRRMQNLVLAADTLQSHLLHFYQLALLDFVDASALERYTGEEEPLRVLKAWVARRQGPAQNSGESLGAAPVRPRWEGRYLNDPEVNASLWAHYAESLQMRRVAHEMGAVFAGRLPHSPALVPGGCTQSPTAERIASYRQRLQRLQAFLERTWLPDVAALAQAFPEYWQIGVGYGHLLCFGSFELNDGGEQLLAAGTLIGGKWEPLDAQAIAEDTRFSWFSSPGKLHPAQGQTSADPHKAGAYSWIKAPRYRGLPMEVGPAARILVNYHSPQPWAGKAEVDKLLRRLQVGPERLVSPLGRMACRVLEAALLVREAERWLARLDSHGPPAQEFKRVPSGTGCGLVEAPRGALGHWLAIAGGKIKHYQCVVPTAWNCSPRDDAGQPGPVEKALEGLAVADPERPIETGRVVRSFDPCLACAVH